MAMAMVGLEVKVVSFPQGGKHKTTAMKLTHHSRMRGSQATSPHEGTGNRDNGTQGYQRITHKVTALVHSW